MRRPAASRMGGVSAARARLLGAPPPSGSGNQPAPSTVKPRLRERPVLILGLILFLLGWAEGLTRASLFLYRQHQAGYPILHTALPGEANGPSSSDWLECFHGHDYVAGPPFRLHCQAGGVHINNLGFRGRELTSEELDQGRLAVVLGASVVFGWGASSDQATHAGRLDDWLAPEGVAVLNAGVPSTVLADNIRLYDQLLAPHDPDLVILYAGWGALYDLFMGTAYYRVVHRIIQISSFLKVLYIKLFFEPFVLSGYVESPEDPAALDRYRERLSGFLLAHPQTPVLLLTLPTWLEPDAPFQKEALVGLFEYSANPAAIHRHYEAVNALLRELGRSPNVTVVDAARDFQQLPPAVRRGLFLADIGHLSDAGHERLARLILPAARQALGLTGPP